MKQTPYWTKKGTVTLSAADQVCLAIRSACGSWARLFKHERRLRKKFGHFKQEDIDIAKRLQRFEKQHGIKFCYGGSSQDIYFVKHKQ